MVRLPTRLIKIAWNGSEARRFQVVQLCSTVTIFDTNDGISKRTLSENDLHGNISITQTHYMTKFCPVPIPTLHPNVGLVWRVCVTMRKCALRGVSAQGSKVFSCRFGTGLYTSLLLGSPRRRKMELTTVALFAVVLLELMRNHC